MGIAATIGFGLLILALLIQIVFLLAIRKNRDRFSHFILLLAAAFFFFAFVQRSVQIRFVAVTSTYESMVLHAGLIALLLFIYRLFSKERSLSFLSLGGTIVAIVLMAASSSPLTSKEAVPPVPALQSHWLVLHVATAIAGEAFFVIGFVVAIIYLLTREVDVKASLDRLMYRTIIVGYMLFTAGGLIFAAIWAEAAWGRYWGWDPKETWSLITWLRLLRLPPHANYQKAAGKGISHPTHNWLSILNVHHFWSELHIVGTTQLFVEQIKGKEKVGAAGLAS